MERINDALIEKLNTTLEQYEAKIEHHEAVTDAEHHKLIQDLTAMGELFPTEAVSCIKMIARAEQAYESNLEYIKFLEVQAEEEIAMQKNIAYAYDTLIEDSLHHYIN